MSKISKTSQIKSKIKDIKSDIIDAGSQFKSKLFKPGGGRIKTRIKAKLVGARGGVNQNGIVDWARLKDHINRSETFWPEL